MRLSHARAAADLSSGGEAGVGDEKHDNTSTIADHPTTAPPHHTSQPTTTTTLPDETQDASNGYHLFVSSSDNGTPSEGGEAGRRTTLQTASDGRTLLIPQPTSDPNDPLNWPAGKKGLILAIIAYIAFLADFSSSVSTITQLPQANQWKKDPAEIAHAQGGNIFCLGAAGPIIVVLSNYFGRLPILLLCLAGSIGTAAWSAAATSFDSFLWARVVHGLFSGIGQSTGLMQIKDMYFLHEHPRKINIWSGAFTAAPFVSPLVFAFVTFRTTWEWCYWVTVIAFAVALLLVIFFVDETYFNRRLTPQPARTSRPLRLLGIEQWVTGSVHNTLWQASSNTVLAMTKLPILLIVLYLFLNFAWFVGVTIAIAVWLQEFYHFDLENLGLFYIAPLIGVAIGEVGGHWAHDFIGRAHAARNHGILHPESRLVMVWPAGLLLFLGVLVLGFALEHLWPWPVLAVFYAIQSCGIIVATTAISAYLLDAYPEAPGEVAAWLNVGRSWGGFMAAYVILEWVGKTGGSVAFGIQAAICGASLGIILFLQVFGQRIRRWQGPISRPSAVVRGGGKGD